MKYIKHLIILLAISVSSSVSSQNELSLSDAIRIGLEQNYDLQITKMNQEVSSINNSWGNTGILPNINFSLNGRENMNYNDNEDYRSETLSPELSLNWVFFNGFSAKINKEKFNLLEEQSQGNTLILIESTIQDIILTYNNCLLQKEIMDVYLNLSQLSEDRYQHTQNSKAIGTSTTFESLQAKTSWLEDQSNYLQQKVNYENAIRTLNYTLGLKEDKQWILSSSIDVNTREYLLDDLKAKLSKNNKSLKNQYLAQSLQSKETALSKSQYYPQLSLNTGFKNSNLSNYYSNSTPNFSQNSSDAYVGVTLSLNLFNGGSTKRAVQIAKISEETAEIKTEQMEHSLNNQLLQMYSNYNVQKAILELSIEKEKAAKLNLDMSNAKFKNGSINSFNYRDVQVVYLNAAISKYQALYKLSQANSDLLRITGSIIDEFN